MQTHAYIPGFTLLEGPLMTDALPVVLVNNTRLDLRTAGIDQSILQAIRSGTALPEEIADLLSLRVIDENGVRRGIVEAR
jgi:hypothetical protein